MNHVDAGFLHQASSLVVSARCRIRQAFVLYSLEETDSVKTEMCRVNFGFQILKHRCWPE